jgi:hypothetical protein
MLKIYAACSVDEETISPAALGLTFLMILSLSVAR